MLNTKPDKNSLENKYNLSTDLKCPFVFVNYTTPITIIAYLGLHANGGRVCGKPLCGPGTAFTLCLFINSESA